MAGGWRGYHGGALESLYLVQLGSPGLLWSIVPIFVPPASGSLPLPSAAQLGRHTWGVRWLRGCTGQVMQKDHTGSGGQQEASGRGSG